MKVKVRLFGHFKNYRPGDSQEIEMELSAGSQLEELVNILGIPREELQFSLLLVNGVQADLNQTLTENDVVSFATVTEGG